MTFFSIILPTYNDLENLKKSIRSIDRQTYKNFELIIVNDGSNDDTKLYLSKLNIPYIKVVNLEKNSGGPATGRNKAIENSSGMWLCFIDSDDFWFKRKLEVMKNMIEEKSNCDVFCHNLISKNKISKKKIKLFSGPLSANQEYKDLLTIGNKLLLSGTCVNSKFLIENKIHFNSKKKYISVEDYDFWLNLSFKDAKFFFIKEFLGIYLKHERNLTNNIILHKKNLLFVIRNHVFRFQKFEKNKSRLWKQLYSKHIIELIMIYFNKFNNYKTAFYLFHKFLRKYNLIFMRELLLFIIRKLKISK